MEAATLHIDQLAVYANVDPTHTTALRNMFANEMKHRFVELCKVVVETVYAKDCFGLKQGTPIRTYQMSAPMETGAFAYPLSADKIKAFEEWLQQQIDNGILTITELEQLGVGHQEQWTDKYVLDSYKRGVIRARYEMLKAGMAVPAIEATGGIMLALSTPFHIDRLGLLYARVFTDLKGITGAMDTQISRILAQGIADGDGPALLARKMVGAINGTGAGDLGLTDTLGRFIPAQRRAEMLARTEIIRAHHVASVQEYRNWAAENVIVQAEFMTAGDARVCDRCASMQGNIYTLDEIEGVIPVHPQCRCIALPYVEGMEKIPTAIMPKGKLAGTKR